jgi:hypothetical protein
VVVAKERLDPVIQGHDSPLPIDDEHRVGRPFKHRAQLGGQRLGLVMGLETGATGSVMVSFAISSVAVCSSAAAWAGE